MRTCKDLEKDLLDKIKPDSWELKRIKYLFKEIIERSEKGEEDLLTVSQFTGVTKTLDNITEDGILTNAESLEGYKKVKRNDLIFNIMLAWNGSLGISNNEGIVSPAYCVYRVKDNSNPKYFHYLFRTDLYKNLFKINSTGVVESRLRLYTDKLFSLPALFPPRSEQDAIVKYLDEKIADIDKYISTKQKLIELLNEQKAAIINKAVTKGIDPNVKMKDCEVEWLGELPEHWEIKKMKFVNKVIMGQSPKSEDYNSDGNGHPFLQGNAEFTKLHPKAILWCTSATKFSEKDDILFSVRAPVGAVNISDQKYGIGRGLSSVRCEKSFNKYIFYQLITRKQEFSLVSSGSTFDSISTNDLKNFYTLHPPYSEQKVICQFIEKKLENIESVIESNILAIKKINEYKNSLIAEAVTGKIKLTANIYEIRTPKNPYFARTVLAAEIINELYKEPTFGRVKLVKLIFLAEKLSKLELGTNYHRQAAGPYDNQAIRSIEKQLKEHKWFETIKRDKGKAYRPLEKINEYHPWFDKYYHNEKHIIHSIINTFRTAKTIQCEIVATLYSAWEDLLKNNSNVDDDKIINEVLNNWHESKKRIPKERWLKALNWMRVKNISPSL